MRRRHFGRPIDGSDHAARALADAVDVVEATGASKALLLGSVSQHVLHASAPAVLVGPEG